MWVIPLGGGTNTKTKSLTYREAFNRTDSERRDEKWGLRSTSQDRGRIKMKSAV